MVKVFDRNIVLTQTEADAKIVGSYEGMASFAGTGPAGETCGSCLFWGRRRKWNLATGEWEMVYGKPRYEGGMIKARRCHRFRQMTGSIPTHGIPHHAAACSQWKPNDAAPPVTRKLRKRRTENGQGDHAPEGVQPAGAADPA